MKHLKTYAMLLLLLPYIGSSQSVTNSRLIERKALSFTLENFDGKPVSLASFKGKTVIVSFWATWCIPCHENFPIMKKLVDLYKDDRTIVFLFIDTRERSLDYVSLAKADMKKHGYDFTVLFDTKGANGKQNNYYDKFEMAGIPTQFFIDGNGTIRYKIEGFNPNVTEKDALQQLRSIIEKVSSPS